MSDNTEDTITICKKELSVAEIEKCAAEGLTNKRTLELLGVNYWTAEKSPKYVDFRRVMSVGRTSIIRRTFVSLSKAANDSEDVNAMKHLLGKICPEMYAGSAIVLDVPEGATPMEKSSFIFKEMNAGNITIESAEKMIAVVKAQTEITKSVEAVEAIEMLRAIPEIAELIKKHASDKE